MTGPIVDGARAVLAARLFSRWTPLMVSWALSYRCNCSCDYCAWPRQRTPELDTQQVIIRVRELAAVGTRVISFTGGEPLLREDLSTILSEARSVGIRTSLNTNGLLLRKRRDVLRWVDRLQLSLDGPRDIQDAIRGNGAFDAVRDAVGLARSVGTDVVVSAVITKRNVDRLDEVLALGRELGVLVSLQPATPYLLGDRSAANPLAPDPARYRSAMERLLSTRRRRSSSLANSSASLRHLAAWPDERAIYCSSKQLIARVEPDGGIMACGASPREQPVPCVPGSLAATMASVPRLPCGQCWCLGTVEVNLCASFHPRALLNAARLAIRSHRS